MKQIYIQNLAMIITNKCNLNCNHCMRGEKGDTHISEQLINTSLSQVCKIDTLLLGGGEPTIALVPLYHLFDFIRKNEINIGKILTIINGTIYSLDFLELLDEIANCGIDVGFYISSDSYHDEQINNLGLSKLYKENLIKYRKSIYYQGIKMINKDTKLFREGNACNLDEELTRKIIPSNVYLTYINDDGVFDKNGLCNVGPMITINQNGIFTEYISSFENQNEIYNYGNVYNESIEENCLKRGKVLKPSKFIEHCNKELKKY